MQCGKKYCGRYTWWVCDVNSRIVCEEVFYCVFYYSRERHRPSWRDSNCDRFDERLHTGRCRYSSTAEETRRIRLSVKNEWNSLHNVHSGRQTDDSVAYVHLVYDRNWSPNNKPSNVHSPRWCATIWKSILCLLTSRQMGAKHRGALERADECT